jgi:hypothetical protein
MAVFNYDPKKVIITVAGIALTGLSDDFIECDRDEDSFIKRAGADGIVSRAKNGNRSGFINITLHSTSPSNAVLTGLLATDEATGVGIVPVVIKEVDTNSAIISAFAWVKRPAKPDYGKEVKDRQWMLDCADLDIINAGASAITA